jgi:putative FmdB family regulatory protein
MPLYEYECEACGQRFEKIQKYSDPLADVCAKCGKGPVRKLLSSPAIQFKGSGFYITDYPKKSSPDSSGSKSSSGGSDSGGESKKDGESKKADTPAPSTSSDKKE